MQNKGRGKKGRKAAKKINRYESYLYALYAYGYALCDKETEALENIQDV